MQAPPRSAHFALLCSALPSCSLAPELEPPRDSPWLQPDVLAQVGEELGDPAHFVPADVHFYARLEGAAGLLDDEDRDPLAREAWRVIEATVPAGFWRASAPRLGLEEKALLRELFARDLVIVEQSLDERREVVVLSRVRTDLLDRLPEAAGLVPLADQARLGPFAIYRGLADDQAYVLAIGSHWLAFAPLEHADHVRRVLAARAAGSPVLADNVGYSDLVARLPAERTAVLFTQSSDREEQHALALVTGGSRLEAHYAARAPDVNRYVEALEATEGVDFGPLPVEVVAAGTINLLTRDVPSEGLLDMLLFPHSFRTRVLARIAPPILLFLGRVEKARLAPDPGFAVPAVGFAIRLKDPAVAAELDRICSGIHFLVSLSRMALAEGFFGVEKVEADGLSYHVADFGPVLRASGDRNLLGKLASLPDSRAYTRIAFGRIGEYYVVCSHPAFFHQWFDATAGRGKRLAEAADLPHFELERRPGLILSALTRGRELAELVDGVAAFVRKARGDGADAGATAEKPTERQAKEIEKPLSWFAGGLEHSRSFSLQVWHGEGGLLQGRLLVLR